MNRNLFSETAQYSENISNKDEKERIEFFLKCEYFVNWKHGERAQQSRHLIG